MRKRRPRRLRPSRPLSNDPVGIGAAVLSDERLLTILLARPPTEEEAALILSALDLPLSRCRARLMTCEAGARVWAALELLRRRSAPR